MAFQMSLHRFMQVGPGGQAVGHHAPMIRIGRVAGRDKVMLSRLEEAGAIEDVKPPRRDRGRRGATELEDRVDRIERILEGLVQVIHDGHNNNNQDDAPQQPAMLVPKAGAMPHTTIKKCIGVSVAWELEHVMGMVEKDTRLKVAQRGIKYKELEHRHQPPIERRNNQLRQGRAFALVLGNTPATNSVVSGILPICDQLAHVLMDSGTLPSGDSMLCNRVYNSGEIHVNDVPMYVDLILLEMHGFDVILEMD
ncbi:hypothetical protein Acr_07g0010640 [Actinidia rufa]|uniref:Uncharacterized protein n=1 Tax=Actinidia rufa TaxID=165716 RepID=A0A7J0EWU7_9ERIC|nr:hypothetical protein Acr_07g0010640 [Actinidia rufa]